MSSGSSKSTGNVSRRDVIKTTAAITAAATFASLGSNFAHAAASDTIRVGLVGCGGRGTGAAGDCTLHSDNVHLVAMGDMFQDRLDGSKQRLKKDLGEKFQVTDE